MFVGMSASMVYICMYGVCMYGCMDVYMYVCMYVCTMYQGYLVSSYLNQVAAKLKRFG